jgi:hypothetical protein
LLARPKGFAGNARDAGVASNAPPKRWRYRRIRSMICEWRMIAVGWNDRGKSEHHKAVCPVKTGAPEPKASGDGQCHRKQTAQLQFEVPRFCSLIRADLKLGLGKGEKAG